MIPAEILLVSRGRPCFLVAWFLNGCLLNTLTDKDIIQFEVFMNQKFIDAFKRMKRDGYIKISQKSKLRVLLHKIREAIPEGDTAALKALREKSLEYSRKRRKTILEIPKFEPN